MKTNENLSEETRQRIINENARDSESQRQQSRDRIATSSIEIHINTEVELKRD